MWQAGQDRVSGEYRPGNQPKFPRIRAAAHFPASRAHRAIRMKNLRTGFQETPGTIRYDKEITGICDPSCVGKTG